MKLSRTLILSTLTGSLISPVAFAETTIGGYGELHYNNLDKNGTDFTELDFHRFVLLIGHDFNDKIRFFSEVELEHALVKDGGSCSVDDANSDNIVNVDELSCPDKGAGEYELEQAYIEIDMDDSSSLKTGIFLLPVGIINETHEPPAFYGVERNPVEKNIIPATWWEGGAMYSAHMSNGLSYDLAIHSGLSNSDGDIRDGRQKVAKSNGDSLAYTARIRYTGMAGLELALSANVQTDLSQGAGVAGDAEGATLLETHVIYATGGLKLTALYANWDVEIDKDPSKETQDGTLLEVSYKLNDKWGVFARQNNWSNADTEDKKQSDIGFNYWPHEDVVYKVDFQSQNADAGNADGFNLGVGFQF